MSPDPRETSGRSGLRGPERSPVAPPTRSLESELPGARSFLSETGRWDLVEHHPVARGPWTPRFGRCRDPCETRQCLDLQGEGLPYPFRSQGRSGPHAPEKGFRGRRVHLQTPTRTRRCGGRVVPSTDPKIRRPPGGLGSLSGPHECRLRRFSVFDSLLFFGSSRRLCPTALPVVGTSERPVRRPRCPSCSPLVTSLPRRPSPRVWPGRGEWGHSGVEVVVGEGPTRVPQ